MKRAGRTSPRRLAVYAVLGSLFFTISLLVESAMPRDRNLSLAATLWPNPWLMLLFYGPLAWALATLIWSQVRLQRGVKRDVWTEAELAPLRKWLEAPIWLWLYAAAFAVLIAVAACSDRHAASFLVMIFPLQTVVSLRSFVKSKTEDPGGVLNLTTSLPLRSEDWGH